MLKVAPYGFNKFFHSFLKVLNNGVILSQTRVRAALSASMVAYRVNETFCFKMDQTE